MTHCTEEQLIDIYYEGTREPHLETCRECREQFHELSAVLRAFDDLPVPEPAPFHWREPFLARLRRRPAFLKPLLVPVLAAALTLAFFAGRLTGPHTRVAPVELADSSRQRILLVALGDHLHRSEIVLVDLANSRDRAGARERARNLIGENRLFRQSILYSGDTAYSGLLEDLDRLLTAVANGQSDFSTTQLDLIERLLFKIRITGSNLQEGTKL